MRNQALAAEILAIRRNRNVGLAEGFAREEEAIRRVPGLHPGHDFGIIPNTEIGEWLCSDDGQMLAWVVTEDEMGNSREYKELPPLLEYAPVGLAGLFLASVPLLWIAVWLNCRRRPRSR